VVSRTDPVVNYWGGGYFGSDVAYPGTTFAQDPNHLVTLATGTITIPASGYYTFCVSSDDGFGLDVSSATDSFRIEYAGLRGTNPTFGSHNFAAGQYTVRMVAFENEGGQSAELIAAQGQFADYNGNFRLVGDTANGGLRVESLPVGGGGGSGVYTPLIHTNVKLAMKDTNASAYIRIPFTLTDLTAYRSLILKMKYDDGFVAYLNGTKVAERYAPTTVAYNSTATAEHSKTDALNYEDIDITAFKNALRVGQNVLAIQGLNLSKSDTDFLILPYLVSYQGLALHFFSTPSPRGPNLTNYYAYVADTKFDHDRGFYDAPFDLAITTTTPGATIRYTLDGSRPTATTGTVYTGPIHIAESTVVRAAGYKTDYEPTNVDTQTYLFIADVLQQTNAVPGYPTTWGQVAADYTMDPDIVNSPLYSAEIADDLKALPSMSITMPIDDMFGASGLYSNTWASGLEKGGSLEYFTADGKDQFQQDAGMRIYGGVGRDPGNMKHSFRILFKGAYGETKLDYPLFPDSPVESFDSIILRAGFNDSWIWGGSGAQYLIDAWSRQTLLNAGVLASHSRFVHLYINGMYWGLYELVERPDGAFASSYFGGQKEDYDALHNDWIDGNGTRWAEMFNLANTGSISGGAYNSSALALSANYSLIQQYLDVPALVDYVLMNFYGGNWDWDWHNWYAAGQRVPAGQFHFFSWDAEGNLHDQNANIDGRNTDGAPTRLFQQLRANAEFQVLLRDHIYKLYFGGGALTVSGATACYQALVDEIYGGIVGESARWGDTKREPPFTRDGDWAATRDWELNTFFATRTANELTNLRSAGMYPALAANAEAPEFNPSGGSIAVGTVLRITNPNSSGTSTLYYTLDGSDPRLPGGGISPSATASTASYVNITLNESRLVRARVKNNSTGLWSAVHEATFVIPTPPPLRITELMFHPYAPEPNSNYGTEDFEFIELKNVGTQSLSISGFHFGAGVTFTFPNMTLASGAYVLAVSNIPAFKSRYTTVPDALIAGQYTGHLKDGGDNILLEGRFSETILDFGYDGDWYPAASNGEGFSIGIVDPLADRGTWGAKASWWPSQYAGGTPGANNVGMAPHTVVINELLAHTNVDPRGDWVELKNTSSEAVAVGGWYLSDSGADLKKYRIAAGTTIAAGGYLLLTERDHFGASGIGFGEYGGKVYLTAADSGDNLLGYREVQEFNDSDREFAFARYVTSTGNIDFVAESANTPNDDNAPPFVGGVVVNSVRYTPGVIINEVMYHPAGDTDEFIELRNCTDVAVPLYDPANPANTWTLGGGVTYTFPADASIPAGGLLLVLSADTDPAVFRSKYGVPADVQILGPYTGHLNNAGENVKLYRPGEPDPVPPYQVPYYLVDRVEYDPAAPWPTSADGLGPSLQRKAPADCEAYPLKDYGNDPVSWYVGPDEGTPGRPNGASDVTPPRLVSAATTDGVPGQVTVTFTEGMDGSSARTPANYSIDHGILVTSVINGPNNRTFVLNTTTLTEGFVYTVTINHVQNLAGIEIAPNTSSTFNYVDAGTGLKGEYFQWTSTADMFNPANLKLTRVDATIDFHWPGGSLVGPGVSDQNFAARWTGTIKPAATGTYTFYTVTDDGVSLWVNRQQLVNDPGWHGDTEFSGSIALEAGRSYEIKMEFYQGGGPATARLLWSGPNQPKAIITSKYLYETSRPGLVSATAQGLTTVAVTFSEEMERDSAQVPGNYQVFYPVGQQIAVTAAVLQPDHKTVLLTLASPLSPGTTYTVTAVNVLARSRPSPVQSGAMASFTFALVGTGNLLREWWLSISGSAVSDLTSSPNFPSSPSGSGQVTSFEEPTNWNNSFGTRIRGYITPPLTGDYVFWIASDDASELWLSTDDTPDHARKIAYVSGATASRQWTKENNQKSSNVVGTITLTAGQRYYVETLHKEGSYSDNLAVRWQLPDATIEEPIPGTRLSLYVPAPATTVSIQATDPDATEEGPSKGTFTITRTGSTSQPLTVYYTVTGTASTADMQQYLTGAVQIPAGSAQVAINVMPTVDGVREPAETVVLTLVPNSAYAIGTPAGATVTISDYTVTLASIQATDPSASETGPNSGTFKISRTGDLSNPLTVHYAVGGAASAADYTPTLGGSVVIDAGAAFTTIVITPVDDTTKEPPETVILTLTPDDDYTLGAQTSASVTIADNDGPKVSIQATDPSASETGPEKGTFVATRTGDLTDPLTVAYLLSGTASANDYTPVLGGTIVFGASIGSVAIDLTPVDDSVDEPTETVVITLSASAEYSLGVPSSATVLIFDNDLPAVSIQATDPNASEAGPDAGTFTVTRAGDLTDSLTAAYTIGGTASANDYTPTLAGTVLFGAGINSAVINIVPVDDAVDEPAETVTLTLSPDANYQIGAGAATVTIADNDLPAVSIQATDPNASETGPDPGTITLTRAGDLAVALTVNYTISGSASAGDYTPALSGSIVFDAGVDSVSLVITPVDDALSELSETVTLTISASPGNYVIAGPDAATVTIADNDPPQMSIQATAPNASETGPTKGTFVVTRFGDPSASLTVNYTVSGTATMGTDYTPALTGAVVFGPDQVTSTIDILPINDTIDEPAETVILTLQPGTGFTLGTTSATVTIADNDYPVVSLQTPDANASETGTDKGTFVVTRVGDLTCSLTVFVSVGGTASAGDYTPALGNSIVFDVGAASITIDIVPVDDTVDEPAETVALTLTPFPAWYTLGTTTSGTVTIADDDLPAVGIEATAPDASETGPTKGTFTITRVADTSVPLTVTYTVSGTATPTLDYTPVLSGSVVFGVGVTSVAIDILPVDDTADEPDETVALTLSPDPSHYVIITENSSATVTIADNDLPTVTLQATDTSASEAGPDPGTFTFTRVGDLTTSLRVYYNTAGTATPDDLQTSLSGSVVIAASRSSYTLNITPVDDAVDEPAETVMLTLSQWSTYTVGTPFTGTVTIADNDLPTVSIQATDANASETGTDRGTFTFTRVGDLSVSLTAYYTVGGTASANDYTPSLSGQVVFGASVSSVALNITPVNDTVDEPAETVILTLTPNSNYSVAAASATVTIADNDLPTVSIQATTPNASETGPAKGTFTVSRVGDTTIPLTVRYGVGGTASSGDYQPVGTSVVIPIGQTAATVDVMPVDDDLPELSETVILTLTADSNYTISTAIATVTIADNDFAAVTAIKLNNQADRGAGSIDPCAPGVRTITVTFSQVVTFASSDVTVRQVTFSGNTEIPGATIAPSSLSGSSTKTMTINLPAESAVDTWVKITLKGNATLKDPVGRVLDGEPKTAGHAYIRDGQDLPTGNGTPGGNAVFYVGSLRGDFATAGGTQIGDGRMTADDVDGFLEEFQADSLEADFRGTASGSTSPDGRVTPADLGAFIALYQAATAASRSLAPLPDPGPLADGDPQPVLLTPPPPAPEMDVLALVPEVSSGGASPQADTNASAAGATALATAATAASGDFGAILTVDPALAESPALASSASAPASQTSADSALAPDGELVDLLALPALDVPLGA
jgi:hypothetical protein